MIFHDIATSGIMELLQILNIRVIELMIGTILLLLIAKIQLSYLMTEIQDQTLTIHST